MVEAVADGQTGLLVAPEDSDALGAAIARLIDDPALAADFGKAGRERMQNEFSVATMADRHVVLYENLLTGERKNDN
jgi:glycosyltransferase involved in cell wall biosynthesis